MGEDHHSNCLIFIAMSHVHQRLKDFDNAINYLVQVCEIYQARFGEVSLEMGKGYTELASAYLKKREYEEAINYQQKALKVYQDIEGAPQELVAEVAITLSEWLEKVERIEEALDVLKQAE